MSAWGKATPSGVPVGNLDSRSLNAAVKMEGDIWGKRLFASADRPSITAFFDVRPVRIRHRPGSRMGSSLMRVVPGRSTSGP